MNTTLLYREKKMKGNKLQFNLKTVSIIKVAKTMKEMKKKKSSGTDGLSQENLILALEVLSSPLTSIINASITKGKCNIHS